MGGRETGNEFTTDLLPTIINNHTLGPSARPYLDYMRALGPFNTVWYGWALDPMFENCDKVLFRPWIFWYCIWFGESILARQI